MIRKFSSYGSVNTKLHYYVPRQALVDDALLKVVGEDPDEGGHYITVWGPRQTGKTWVMQQVLFGLQTKKDYERFAVAKINLQTVEENLPIEAVIDYIASRLSKTLAKPIPHPKTLRDFEDIFSQEALDKPLILILDEFDSLAPAVISDLVRTFRNIYVSRQDQMNESTAEKDYLLHSIALIGVRAVLGIENATGSPFNVQRNLHVPNLTFAEVDSMFHWYERESGQQVEQAVIDRIFYETNGQPGLVGWLGELLTVTFNKHNPAIVKRDFEIAYAAAVDALPNSNIVNIISKAKQDPYQALVLSLFQTSQKIPFRYDDPETNFLYMNGVVEQEVVNETERYLKFPCPFVQKRLFNYFAHILFKEVGQLYAPLDDLDDVFTPQGLHIQSLLKRYEHYLQQNRAWLFKNAPRRHDLRLYEAVYHFNFYMYLAQFLQSYEGQVWPEFPTGNGADKLHPTIDLKVEYEGQTYGLEVKSFTNKREYEKALKQAADYAQQLQLTEITLVLFIEAVDDKNRAKYEVIYHDPQRDIRVEPVFVVTGA